MAHDCSDTKSSTRRRFTSQPSDRALANGTSRSFASGNRSSNPSPSSGESRANLAADQALRAHDIGRGRIGHRVKGAGSELDRQPALRRD
jgi:hypothetical protein